jgi:hypothetical protein
MKDICYFHHHLGLGDHIICNGMVRETYKKYSKLFLMCKYHNSESVKFMFRDLQNLIVCPIKDDTEASSILERERRQSDIIYIGNKRRDWLSQGDSWDRSFYRQAGMDFNIRWDSYCVSRDSERENALYEKYFKNNSPYIFVHDAQFRNMLIDDKKIDIRNRKIFRILYTKENPETNNIFDYCKILENAEEIHCMDSCFDKIVDSMTTTTDKIYYHDYGKPINYRNIVGYHQYRRKWIFIR